MQLTDQEKEDLNKILLKLLKGEPKTIYLESFQIRFGYTGSYPSIIAKKSTKQHAKKPSQKAANG